MKKTNKTNVSKPSKGSKSTVRVSDLTPQKDARGGGKFTKVSTF